MNESTSNNEAESTDSKGTPQSEFPKSGRLAGIDYGTVRIGVSICNAGQTIASPLDNYTRRSQKLDNAYFSELAKQERIVGFVVGLPIHSSGDESQKSKEARVFGKRLGETTGLPVTWFDERYTTAHAEQLMQGSGLTRKKRKQRLDKLAAQILLSTYLESTRKNESTGSIED